MPRKCTEFYKAQAGLMNLVLAMPGFPGKFLEELCGSGVFGCARQGERCVIFTGKSL